MVNRIGRFTPVAETDPPSADAVALVSGELLSVRQVMERTGYSKSQLYVLMDAGKIPFIQDGPRCRRIVPEVGLLRFLASRLKH